MIYKLRLKLAEGLAYLVRFVHPDLAELRKKIREAQEDIAKQKLDLK